MLLGRLETLEREKNGCSAELNGVARRHNNTYLEAYHNRTMNSDHLHTKCHLYIVCSFVCSAGFVGGGGDAVFGSIDC